MVDRILNIAQVINDKCDCMLPFSMVVSFFRKSVSFLFFFSSFLASLNAQKVIYRKIFTVAQDGTGDFVSIQDAVNAVRDFSQQRVTIHIKKGFYKEKICIPKQKPNITLEGEERDSTIISNGDYSSKTRHNEKDAIGLVKFSTFTSYTLMVQGNDVIVKNLTIENTAGKVGQAVALHIEGDRVEVINCNIYGNQDTLYAAVGRQYYLNCTITGTTDFIFGKAVALFEKCLILSKQNSYITAASTDSMQKFGFVFLLCKLSAQDNVTRVYLGRPWRPYAKTVFIKCDMDKHICPEGWDNWRDSSNNKTVFYAEYKSKGKGANPTKRVPWSYQLTTKQLKKYTIRRIFSLQEIWQPS